MSLTEANARMFAPTEVQGYMEASEPKRVNSILIEVTSLRLGGLHVIVPASKDKHHQGANP